MTIGNGFEEGTTHDLEFPGTLEMRALGKPFRERHVHTSIRTLERGLKLNSGTDFRHFWLVP